MDMNYRGGMWEGGGVQDGVKRGKWDNCNSIINKIYLKKIINGNGKSERVHAKKMKLDHQLTPYT